jgi:hypothetical protein
MRAIPQPKIVPVFGMSNTTGQAKNRQCRDERAYWFHMPLLPHGALTSHHIAAIDSVISETADQQCRF